MSSVSLCVVATGKYQRFLPRLIDSARRFFLAGHDVHYLLFADVPGGDHRQLVIPHLPWPLPTLMRYHFLSQYPFVTDFIFYIDADMEFVRPVGDEILGDLVAVHHPGYFGRPRQEFTYETNPRSRACVQPHEGVHYFAGGFQGGSREHYGTAMAWMRDAINEDLRNHVIPLWHDESIWQRYLVSRPPTIALSPDYCSTPRMNHGTRKIIALDKDFAEMRS